MVSWSEFLLQILTTYIAFDYIVGVGSDVTGKSEVADLGHSTLCEENVSGCQVPVNTLNAQTKKKKQTHFNMD